MMKKFKGHDGITRNYTFYKVVGPRGQAVHGGVFHYSLPSFDEVSGEWIAGNWTPNVFPYVCRQGYHIVTRDELAEWLSENYIVYECEARGHYAWDEDGAKVAFESIRLLHPVGTVPVTYRTRLPYSSKRRTPHMVMAILTAKVPVDVLREQDDADWKVWRAMHKAEVKRAKAAKKRARARALARYERNIKNYEKKLREHERKTKKYADLRESLKSFKSNYQYGQLSFTQGWLAARGLVPTRRAAAALIRFITLKTKKPEKP